MFGSAQSGTPLPQRREPGAESALPSIENAISPGHSHVLERHELESALQLLVGRAQYITGATGAALALASGEEMICRASVGSGPAVGAHLQVHSGLTGESVARKQLLRCDNVDADPRVNLETCRQLGIASIVVMPLLSRTGEVRGLFEMFSDHPYAFEERDLIALERMAGLTMTALELAEKQIPSVAAPIPLPVSIPVPPTSPPLELEILEPIRAPAQDESPGSPVEEPASAAPDNPLGPALVHSVLNEEPAMIAAPAAVPEAMLRVQKCASCGFPVSEGRTLCLDCENKRDHQTDSAAPLAPEFVPAFLADSPPPDESWLANHVNLLAVLVLVLSIVVAVVVFR